MKVAARRNRIDAGRAIVGLIFLSCVAAALASRLAGELDAPGLQRTIAREKGRVVLLNFWATWCVPCREEFPELSRLQERHRAAGLTVVGVSIDFDGERASVEKFLAEQRPPFANYRKKSGGDDEKFIDAVDPSWGGELPFSVLYDRAGRKVRVYSGSLPLSAAEKEIRRLLATPRPLASGQAVLFVSGRESAINGRRRKERGANENRAGGTAAAATAWAAGDFDVPTGRLGLRGK